MNTSLKTGSLMLFLALGCFQAAQGMSPGTADYKEKTQMNAGVDIVGELPVGNFADNVGFGLGGLGHFEYGLNNSFALTARAGYVYFFEKDNGPISTTYSQVPLLAGVKYSLIGAPIYVAGELGAVIGMTDVDNSGFGGGSGSSTSTNFAWDVGAGYELGPVDIRLSLNFPDAGNMGDAMTVGLSFGYNFWGK